MTMIPLSMKSRPALFCGIIFVFFFLETRSQVTTSNQNITVHSTAEVTSVPHSGDTQNITNVHTPIQPATTAYPKTPATPAVNINVTTATSTGSQDLPHSSTNQTTMNEAPSSYIQNGTENLTSESFTTESPLKVTLTEVKSTHIPSTTIVPKTEPKPLHVTSMLQKNGTTLAPKTTREVPSSNSTIIATTSATMVTNQSTLLPNITTTKLAPTTKPLTTEIALPATPEKNITNSLLNQTTATTELPSSTINPTNGTTISYTTPPETTTEQVTSQPTQKTSVFTTAYTGKASTINDTPTTTDFSTNATSNSTVLIPIIPKKLTTSKPNPTTVTKKQLTTTTTAQPCSSLSIVKQCLIIIASLAVVATIFIVCTIVLCTKLSKYKIKKQQQGTEMMCISSLLPERTHNYTRQRNPVPNGGVRVIPYGGDSDDELGDNLTLSSFLPENDRYV